MVNRGSTVPGWLTGALLALLHANSAAAQGGFASVGAELDDESGYIVFGTIGGQWSSTTSWDLSASRSETPTALATFAKSSYGGRVYHDFGLVGVRVGLGGWRDEDIVRVGRLSTSVDLHGQTWSVSLMGESKRSDFDTFIVDRTIERRDGSLVAVAGRVDCSVDDTGLGGRLAFFSEGWSFSLSAMGYDYDDFGCEFDLQGLDLLRRATRDEFVQLADRATDLLTLGSARRLLAESSFIDSRFSLSLRRETAARAYSAYFDRVEDAFFGQATDILSAGISFPVRERTELEVYAGITRSELGSDIAFVGLVWLIGF